MRVNLDRSVNQFIGQGESQDAETSSQQGTARLSSCHRRRLDADMTMPSTLSASLNLVFI
jgi:hypothetical protein